MSNANLGADGVKSLQVRQTDAAGNLSPAASLSFILAHGTAIDNGDGTEHPITFNTTGSGSWAYTNQLWQQATTSTADPTVYTNDWVTTGSSISLQPLTHSHTVVTQYDSVELSVTTVNTNGSSRARRA